MPPPRVVEKEIGEKRIIGFSPVGISVCPELDVEAILADIPAGKAQAALASHLACFVFSEAGASVASVAC